METVDSRPRPSWQNTLGWVAAVIMAFLWFSAGLWKLADIGGWQLKLNQLLVPIEWTLPGTLAVAVAEVFAGVLLLRPVWRRLGGYLSVGLLLAFMAYMAINYETLQGTDCSCFPWLERAVGPAFFWSDGGMAAIGALAAWFAPPMSRFRGAGYALIAVCLVGGIALAYDRLAPSTDADVPASVRVEDGELSLHQGRVFVFFLSPMCIHCLDAATAMAKHDWKAEFVGVPTEDPDLAAGFVEDSGLQSVKLSPDVDLLKEKFPFGDPPYAVAIENGQIRERFMFFEEPALGEKLRELGFLN